MSTTVPDSSPDVVDVRRLVGDGQIVVVELDNKHDLGPPVRSVVHSFNTRRLQEATAYEKNIGNYYLKDR